MVPTKSKNWIVTGTDKDFDGLELHEAKIPELSEDDMYFFQSVERE
jgi:hypothetical protein